MGYCWVCHITQKSMAENSNETLTSTHSESSSAASMLRARVIGKAQRTKDKDSLALEGGTWNLGISLKTRHTNAYSTKKLEQMPFGAC